MEFAIVECALNMILDIVHIYLELLKLATGLVNEVVVVVVVTRHGGVATFAEAVFKLQPQDTETQGTFQVEKEWYQSGKVAEAREGRIV